MRAKKKASISPLPSYVISGLNLDISPSRRGADALPGGEPHGGELRGGDPRSRELYGGELCGCKFRCGGMFGGGPIDPAPPLSLRSLFTSLSQSSTCDCSIFSSCFCKSRNELIMSASF